MATDSEPNFFISYKRIEGDKYAEMIEKELAGLHVRFWRDVNNLRYGQKWTPEIDNAIDNTLALLLVVTPGIVGSAWITYEWARAMGKGIPVIPIRFIPVKDEDLHDQIRAIMHADYTKDGDTIWGKLFSELEKIVMDFPAVRMNYLLEQIRNPNLPLEIRKKAINDIDDYYVKGLADELLKVLKNPEHEIIQSHIAVALGNFGDPKVIPDLLEIAARNDIRNSHMALLALNRLGDPSVAPHLKEYLTHEDEWMRSMAAEAMGIYQYSEAIESLIDMMLNDSSWGARWYATVALGKIEDQEALEALHRATKDDHVTVRQSAIEALGRFRNPASVPVLIEALKDTAFYYANNRICDAAAEVLGTIPSEIGKRELFIWRKKQPKKRIR